MKKVIVLLLVLLLVGVTPVFAGMFPSNVEHMDEVDLVYEIGASDALWGSEHLDVGVMTGITNLGNPWNTEKTSSYVMVKADVKGIRLLNRLLDLFNK